MEDINAGGTFICRDEDAVAQLARALASHLGAPLTIAFSGDLGAGKTTFIRYLCEALGTMVPITSPTYVLSYEYPTRSGILIEHWDLYRVFEPVPELLEPPASQTIRLIEWAERMVSWGEPPEVRIAIGFADVIETEVTQRMITIEPVSLAESLRKGGSVRMRRNRSG